MFIACAHEVTRTPDAHTRTRATRTPDEASTQREALQSDLNEGGVAARSRQRAERAAALQHGRGGLAA